MMELEIFDLFILLSQILWLWTLCVSCTQILIITEPNRLCLSVLNIRTYFFFLSPIKHNWFLTLLKENVPVLRFYKKVPTLY